MKEADLCQDFKRNDGFVTRALLSLKGAINVFVRLRNEYWPKTDVVRSKSYWLMSSDTLSA